MSIWDTYTHEQNSGRIEDNSTGDVACDSYNLWQKDIELIRDLGVCTVHRDHPEIISVLIYSWLHVITQNV
jgi:beta-glucosidase/6-phospho-beta-glucosidase/beta-galactosidase